MKYILTENQAKKLLSVVSEQLPMAADIITSAADFGVNLDVGASKNLDDRACKIKKNSSELVLSVFAKSRGTSGRPNINDKTIQSWVSRISKSMDGAGITGDFQKVLSEIKTPQQLGSVLEAYETKFKRKLYNDLKGEYTISWDTIWNYIKKFSKTLSIDYCRERITMST